MARHATAEEEAERLFARQLDELRAEGVAPASEARLAAISAIRRLFGVLDDGVGLGTGRPELGQGDDVRFVPTAPYPFLAVYDRSQGLVLEITTPAATIGIR